MNEPTDDQIVTRMRMALDELTSDVAADDDTVVSVRPAALRTARRRGAWLGAAAVTVLLAGGAVWALSTRTEDPVASPEPTDPTVLAATTASGGSTPATGSERPTYTIASARLAPGELVVEQEPVTSDALVQAWRVQGDGLDGFLTAVVLSESPFDTGALSNAAITDLSGFPDGTARQIVSGDALQDMTSEPVIEWRRSDGDFWLFQQAGLIRSGSEDTWLDLVRSAVSGSGLPIVVADERATSIGVSGLSTTFVRQEFTGVDGGMVSFGLTDSLIFFGGLGGLLGVEPITVADRPGWRVVTEGEAVTALWDAGDGWYGVLNIPFPMSAAADDIIASVVRTDGTPTASTVATPETAQRYEVLGTIVEFPTGTFAIEVPTPDQSVIQLELRNFSWEAVSIERSAFDGAVRSEPGVFTVRDYQDRSAAFVSVQVLAGFAQPLDPCVFDQEVLPLDELNALDERALDIAGYGAALNGDGTCDRIVLFVFVDSVELREAIKPIADAVEVRPLLTPL
jgi:hypothetical protein